MSLRTVPISLKQANEHVDEIARAALADPQTKEQT